MNIIKVENVQEIAELMFSMIVLAGKADTSFVGAYDDAAEVLKGLCKYDELEIGYLELESLEITGYKHEYIVSLTEDMKIFCEKVFDIETKTYLSDENEVLFVADDCNSKLLNTITGKTTFEVSLCDKEENDLCYHCCCNDCRLCEFD